MPCTAAPGGAVAEHRYAPGNSVFHGASEYRGRRSVLGGQGCWVPAAVRWFTERGWRAYGLRVAAGVRASGRAFRVIRRKNPLKSLVIYRDDWQVALLPDRDADHVGRGTASTSRTSPSARPSRWRLTMPTSRSPSSARDADSLAELPAVDTSCDAPTDPLKPEAVKPKLARTGLVGHVPT